MERAFEIIYHSKITGFASPHTYAATLDEARALVLHHLTAGRYDRGSVFGPNCGGQAKFRAIRWYSPYFVTAI